MKYLTLTITLSIALLLLMGCGGTADNAITPQASSGGSGGSTGYGIDTGTVVTGTDLIYAEPAIYINTETGKIKITGDINRTFTYGVIIKPRFAQSITDPVLLRDYFSCYLVYDLLGTLSDLLYGDITYACYIYSYAPVYQDGEFQGDIGLRGAMGHLPDWLISAIAQEFWVPLYGPIPDTNPYDIPCE